MGFKMKKKKKFDFLPRRRRERNRSSFLFVIFFVGMIGLVVIIQSFSDASEKDMDTESDFEDLRIVKYDYHEEITLEPKSSLRIVSAGTYQQNITTKYSTNTRKKMLGVPIQTDWQPVTGASDKFFVYSAYYISRPTHIIRVIGATKTKTQQRIQCRLYDNDGNHYSTIDGRIRTIRENWNLKFSACFIICSLSTEVSIPRYVSVMPTSSPVGSTTNILRVTHSNADSELDATVNDFSICVKPIHFNYNNVLQLLEWIEFHKLMGVTRFTFYNHTIGKNVDCLLKEVYQDEVRVHPWKLPMVSQKEIRTEGLFAALNDCVYRHRGLSKYLALVDLDEMIVPRRADNYSQLIDELDTLSNKKKIGAYSFQNGFFYLQWPNDPTTYNLTDSPLADTVSRHLLMLRKTRRRSRLHPHKQRSKYICDPEKVVEAGNHFIWEMISGYNTLSVPSHLASLHHYRVCEFGGNQCVKSPSVVDKSILPFGKILAYNVANKIAIVTEKCHISISKILENNLVRHF